MIGECHVEPHHTGAGEEVIAHGHASDDAGNSFDFAANADAGTQRPGFFDLERCYFRRKIALTAAGRNGCPLLILKAEYRQNAGRARIGGIGKRPKKKCRFGDHFEGRGTRLHP